MKNLKKVLSLVLALAMALSLMTAAFAKDASDFTDYSKVTNKEAVDVMVAMGVFDGMNGTEFAPTGTLTREQAAKIITYMVMGKDAADKLTTSKAPFADVSADRWSAGAIAYCASEGIVSGVGNNKFNPTGELTGQEFGKMLLVALGYDAQIENMVGASWAINVSKLAVTAGLDTNLGSLSAKMTREQAAQMAFNAEKATLVAYEGGTNITTGDGTSIVVDAKRYNVGNALETASQGYNKDEATPYTQFCERYAKDLTLKTADGTADAFGRPSVEWKLKSTVVGTYAGSATFTYTTDCTTGSAKTDLTKALKGYDFSKLTKDSVYTNGKAEGASGVSAINSADELAAKTGNGVLVEVYTNDNKEVTDVAIITQSIYQITKIDTKNKQVSLTEKTAGAIGTAAVVDEDNSNYAALSNMKVDDYVLVTAAYDTTAGKYVVETAVAPTTVTGKVSKVVKDESVTVDGATYKLAKNENAVSALGVDAKTDKVLYLDSYGYALYTTAVGATSSVDTVYVTVKYEGMSDWGKTNMFQGVLADGTVITGEYTGSVAPVAGKAYQYTMDGGKYKLEAAKGGVEAIGVKALATATINKNDTKLTANSMNNYYASTVKFVFVNGEKSDLKVTVKEGVQDIKVTANDYAVIAKDANGNYVVTAVFVKGAAVTSSSDIVYVANALSGSNSTGTMIGTDGKTVLTGYDVYVNGEKKTIYFSGTQTKDAGFYTYSIDEATGAYTLGSEPTNVIKSDSITQNGVTYVNGKYYIDLTTVTTTDAYDATNAQVVDTTKTENGISSMNDLKDAVKSGAKNVAVVYDSDAKTVVTIYVLAD